MKLAIFSCFVAVAFAYHKYEGYQVLSIEVQNDDQARLLRNWMLQDDNLDFWHEASHGGTADVMVAPRYRSTFEVKLRKHDFRYKVLHDDINIQVERLMTRLSKKSKVFDIDDFNTYDDIVDWVQNTVPGTCATGLTCTTAVEGQSYENRDIVSITMSTGSGRQTFLINSLIHAREWLTGATVSKIIDHMATGYGSDSDVTNLLDSYDFVFIPVLNPDGYDYTWTNERLWRKNRRPQSSCIGVDLNRNYDYNWGEEGVSTNPCSDLYCGESGNSEPETQVMVGVMERYANGNGVLGYLDVHSYGQMWMHPWGNTVDHAGRECERAEDHDDMFWVADRAADAIEATFNTFWLRGTSCEVIYETTGATDDYIKGALGVKYPICPELRGNGFIVSADEIQPSFEEIWNGIVEMVNSIEIREGLKL